ncbi:hypothetical protein G6F37_013319 [Rhizopus arrhizus]|nr:hypothetical protein G6F38_013322 [Rhizopus arrhizus]KAG1138501.1 hypothetical protein G6F37_013319 [Rhizopus arrhizus]
MFRGLPNDLEPPAPPTDNFLLGNQEMLDHIKLQQSVQNATQRTKRNIKGPRPRRFETNGNTFNDNPKFAAQSTISN